MKERKEMQTQSDYVEIQDRESCKTLDFGNIIGVYADCVTMQSLRHNELRCVSFDKEFKIIPISPARLIQLNQAMEKEKQPKSEEKN